MRKKTAKSGIPGAIGIDIGPSYLRAVQISRGPDGLHIEKSYQTKLRRATDSGEKILASLTTEYDFNHMVPVAISIDRSKIFFRTVHSHQTQAGTTGLNPNLQNEFPLPPEQIIVQPCSDVDSTVKPDSFVLAATTRDAVLNTLNIAKTAGLNTILIDSHVCAIHTAALFNHPSLAKGRSMIVHSDGIFLTMIVLNDNKILVVRNLPVNYDSGRDFSEDLITNIESTWVRAFAENPGQDNNIFIAVDFPDGSSGASSIERNFNCHVIPVDLSAGNQTDQKDIHADMAIAIGLALRIIEPQQAPAVNYLDLAKAEPVNDINVRKETITIGSLAAAIVAVLILGVFIKLYTLESAHARIEQDITSTFRQALPEEKNIVIPLAQLDDKLQQLKRKNILLGFPETNKSLQTLEMITSSVPADSGITIQDMLITQGMARLNGLAPSFEPVYQWKDSLQTLENVRAVRFDRLDRQSKDKNVDFTIVLSFAGSE